MCTYSSRFTVWISECSELHLIDCFPSFPCDVLYPFNVYQRAHPSIVDMFFNRR